ncbi:MAG: glycine--tRNA ligase subunit beta [Tissierellia bacterium]|nr:glycine--tRNA ligase subunit beta [Tissierellia bacterium]
MNKYLIELGVEELPSSYVSGALKAFEDYVAAKLTEERLSFSSITPYATPRRLALIVEGLPDKQEDREELVKGPAQKIAYREDGSVNKPLEGFMRSTGVSEEELIIQELKGVPYVYANVIHRGKRSQEVLQEIIPSAIRSIPFEKTMRWGGKNLRFARPIRWLLSLFNDEVVLLDFEGIGCGRITRGHRFLGSQSIEIDHVDEYVEKLLENYVIADPQKRKDEVQVQIRHLAKSMGGEIRSDDDLLEEVTYIVEYPTAILGRIKDEYLYLPPVVLTTPMRDHLRYYPVYDPDGGLMPYFITVRNGNGEYKDIVSAGNEKVLDARLDDARFFFENDRKRSLEDFSQGLDSVLFQQKLGSMKDKTQRMGALAKRIGEELKVSQRTLESSQRAIALSKGDLVTEMVQEFTELEGTMGEIYALADGEEAIVAQAIREQYMPRSSGAEIPQSTTGSIVSLSDKLDTIAGLFAIGKIPTGSQDPFGLRRKAIGILRILKEKKWTIGLEELINSALAIYVDNQGLIFDDEKVRRQIVDFFLQRLEGMLAEEKIPYDVINAVLAVPEGTVLSIFQKAHALQDFLAAEDRDAYLDAAGRIHNIAQKNPEPQGAFNEELMEAGEMALWEASQKLMEPLEAAIALGDFKRALELTEVLTPVIHQYFDDVMIMAEDEGKRNNRLHQIHALDGAFTRLFSVREIVH